MSNDVKPWMEAAAEEIRPHFLDSKIGAAVCSSCGKMDPDKCDCQSEVAEIISRHAPAPSRREPIPSDEACPVCGQSKWHLGDCITKSERTAYKAMREALENAISIANEAYNEWDRDNDMRVGKILIALAGRMPKYRPDIDQIHAAMALAKEGGQ